MTCFNHDCIINTLSKELSDPLASFVAIAIPDITSACISKGNMSNLRMKGSSNVFAIWYFHLKIVNIPHSLEMATATMRPTIIIVPLMEATVVDLVYPQNIVQIANAFTMTLTAMEFRMLWSQMVSVMMKPTMQIVTTMVVTVALELAW